MCKVSNGSRSGVPVTERLKKQNPSFMFIRIMGLYRKLKVIYEGPQVRREKYERDNSPWYADAVIAKAGRGRMLRHRRRYGGRKTRYRKRKRTGVAAVSRKVRTLQRRVEADMGTLVHKQTAVTQLSSAPKLANMLSLFGSDVAAVEIILSALPVFDSSTGNTSNIDFTSGTVQKEIEISKTWSKLTVKNNSLKPAEVDVYCVVSKSDTSISAQTAVGNGLTDVGTGLGITTVQTFPTDSHQFRDLYKIVKHKKAFLLPGKQVKLSYSGRPYQFDPSFVDAHGQSFQKRYNSHQYLVRTQGVIGCGTGVTVGYADSRVDVLIERIHEVKYAAGADLHRIVVSDGQTLDNNGVTVVRDVEANGTL